MENCNFCLMDKSDPDLTLDSMGKCNHCILAEQLLDSVKFSNEQEKNNLTDIKRKILDNKGSGKYDAILGISGGVDSSYLCHLMHQLGLNVLLVHCDNGWNSMTAISNIKKLIDVTKFDLHTQVLHWPEFKDLQRAYLKAGVVDIEVLTDHANRASMFRLAKEHKIKMVISGQNFATENSMPKAWVWNKRDLLNIKSIHRKFGKVRLKKFPTLGSLELLVYTELGLGLKYIEPLNKINYSKSMAIRTLSETYGWEYYGGKHYESIFTKFYQSYILPTKFGIDKRRVHLSDIMRNGELTLDQAKLELEKPLYSSLHELEKEKKYVLSKLDFTEEEFDRIMESTPVSHRHYRSDEVLLKVIRFFGKPIKSWVKK